MKDFSKGFLFGILICTIILVGFGISEFEVQAIFLIEIICGFCYGVVALFKK